MRNGKLDYVSGEVDEKKVWSNGYGYYFGSDFDRIVYTNGSDQTGKNLLVIGDSFTQPIEPLLASAYAKTHVLDPRYFKGSIRDYIGENDIDDVVVLVCATTLKNGDALDTLAR